MTQPADHQTLLRGGNVLTMAEPLRAEAVLVRGARIACVGTEQACVAAATAEPEVVDLQGATLLPGFVDAHCHPLAYGQFESWTDCSWESAPAIASVIERLRATATELDAGAPVRGHGFHQGHVADKRYLRRDDLDQVATDREVTVFHASGHGAFVNSWALETLGIDASTPDPQGGQFLRDDDGTPTGGLWDAAIDALTGADGVKVGHHAPNIHIPDDPATLIARLAWAQEVFLADGVTSVLDAQVTSRELATYLGLRRAGGLRFRVELMVLSSLLDQLEALGLGGRLGDDRLAVSAVKLYVDGAVLGGSAHTSAPYCCDPLNHGYVYHDVGEFHELVRRAHRLGLQTGAHAMGDAAVGIAIDAFAAAMREDPRPNCRHRIEHCALPSREDVARIAEVGLWPVTQPQYIDRMGDQMLEMLGDRVQRLKPLGEFVAAGIPFVISSDSPVTSPEPLKAIAAAVTRRTRGGRQLGDDDLRIDVLTALRAHTLGAAASMHREATIGSVEVGKYADFAVLSDDPTLVAAERLPELAVLQTWIGGELVSGARG